MIFHKHVRYKRETKKNIQKQNVTNPVPPPMPRTNSSHTWNLNMVVRIVTHHDEEDLGDDDGLILPEPGTALLQSSVAEESGSPPSTR